MLYSNILNQILSETHEASQKPLCVFDLDSTLICVSQRTRAILQAAAVNEGFKHFSVDHLKKMKNITVKAIDFSLQDILNRAQVQLPIYQYRLIYKYWASSFFSNSFLKYDTLYKGVQNYLSQLSINSDIIYLTGRSQELMREGTDEQIKKWNLPLKSEKHLIMKPNNFTEDAIYKKMELEKLVQHYKNIWFFENDPAIINHVNNTLPQIQVIFIQSASSGRQILRKKFPTIGMDYSL